jgi:hypothetical protein
MHMNIQFQTVLILAAVVGCNSPSRHDEPARGDTTDGSAVGVRASAAPPVGQGQGQGQGQGIALVKDKTGAEPNSVPAGALAQSAPRYAPRGPEVPMPQVFFEPVDMTSAVGASPLQVAVHVNQGGTITDATFASLASQVSLVEWPEMKEVPAIKQVKRLSGEVAIAGYVTVVPSRPLADRWYALKVASMPPGLAWPTFAAQRAMADGAAISRFRTGSDPQVASVRACDKNGQTLLIVDFSERVAVTDARLITARYQSGSALACQSWEPVGPDGAMSMSRLCDALDDNEALDIGVRQGALGAAAPAMAPLHIGLKTMIAWGEGCRAFRP